MNRILHVADKTVLDMMMELLFGICPEHPVEFRQHAFFFDEQIGAAEADDMAGRIEATLIQSSVNRGANPLSSSKKPFDPEMLARLAAKLRSAQSCEPWELPDWDARMVPQRFKPGRFEI